MLRPRLVHVGMRMRRQRDPQVAGTIVLVTPGLIVWEADTLFTIEYRGKVYPAKTMRFATHQEVWQLLTPIREESR